MSDFIKPETEHLAKGYYYDLHGAINYLQSQTTAALRKHRLKKENEFDISGVRVSFEQVLSAKELFIDPQQSPHFEMNLFEKENAAVKKVIQDLEKFLDKVQKIFKGIKVPKRPKEVDEWMKK